VVTPQSTQDLLLSIPDALRDRLVSLDRGPSVVDELTGDKPHKSAIYRWARDGLAGRQLRTVTVGKRRYTTRRWLLEWFCAVDAARRSQGETGGAT